VCGVLNDKRKIRLRRAAAAAAAAASGKTGDDQEKVPSSPLSFQSIYRGGIVVFAMAERNDNRQEMGDKKIIRIRTSTKWVTAVSIPGGIREISKRTGLLAHANKNGHGRGVVVVVIMMRERKFERPPL
jgi:hypothetical protein